MDASQSMVAAARERLGDPSADVRRMRPARARARRAGRRDPLDRDVPLDRRPRRAVRAPARARCAPAGGWWRSAGERATSTALRGRAGAVMEREPYAEHFRDFRPPWNYATRRDTQRAAAGGRASPTAECWLAPAPHRARAPARVPVHDRARPARPAPARAAARAVHGRGDGRAGRAGRRRLRAPEHRRDRDSPTAGAAQASAAPEPAIRSSPTSAPLNSAA